jgi:hypothetical protein
MSRTSRPGQATIQAAEARKIAARCLAFNEIMTGPNPLTRDEIRTLIRRRPEKYGIFSAWVTSPEEG